MTIICSVFALCSSVFGYVMCSDDVYVAWIDHVKPDNSTLDWANITDNADTAIAKCLCKGHWYDKDNIRNRCIECQEYTTMW